MTTTEAHLNSFRPLPVLAPFRQSAIGNFDVQVVIVQHSFPADVFGIRKPGLDIQDSCPVIGCYLFCYIQPIILKETERCFFYLLMAVGKALG